MLGEVKNLLKVSGIIATVFALSVAISLFFNLILPIVVPSFFKEVLLLISVFAPFDASAVFTGIGYCCSSILAFMIGVKIFNLNSGAIKSA